MEHHSKLVIPTGTEYDAPLPSPHFNEESTMLAARPVVPLAASGGVIGNAVSMLHATPFAKRILPLSLIVATAIGVGIAGGLALSHRHQTEANSANNTAAPQPDVPAPSIAETSNLPVRYTDDAAQEKSAKTETQTTTIKQSDNAPTLVAPASNATRDKRRQSSVESSVPQQSSLPPVATRNRRSQDDAQRDDDERIREDEARAARRAAREQRRRAQTEQPNAAPLPRQVERAKQQLNRIKEIFEGQKP